MSSSHPLTAELCDLIEKGANDNYINYTRAFKIIVALASHVHVHASSQIVLRFSENENIHYVNLMSSFILRAHRCSYSYISVRARIRTTYYNKKYLFNKKSTNPKYSEIIFN